jgi:hypothetical protein
MSSCSASGKAGDSCSSYLNILINTAATRPNSSDHHTVNLQWNAAAKNHHSGVIGRIEPEALLAGLRDVREILRRHIECPSCPRLVDCDIDAA